MPTPKNPCRRNIKGSAQSTPDGGTEVIIRRECNAIYCPLRSPGRDVRVPGQTVIQIDTQDPNAVQEVMDIGTKKVDTVLEQVCDQVRI